MIKKVGYGKYLESRLATLVKKKEKNFQSTVILLHLFFLFSLIPFFLLGGGDTSEDGRSYQAAGRVHEK